MNRRIKKMMLFSYGNTEIDYMDKKPGVKS